MSFSSGAHVRFKGLRTSCAALCLFTISIAAFGCGQRSHELQTAVVKGRVTLDGQPLPGGVVFVLPKKGRMAKAMIEPDGTFALSTYRQGDGAQVGTHPVIITAVPRDELDAKSKANPVPVPKRYARPATSGLTIEVKARTTNEIAFELTSTDP